MLHKIILNFMKILEEAHTSVPAINIHWNDIFIISWIFSNILLYSWLYLIYLVIARLSDHSYDDGVLSIRGIIIALFHSLSKICLPDLIVYTYM